MMRYPRGLRYAGITGHRKVPNTLFKYKYIFYHNMHVCRIKNPNSLTPCTRLCPSVTSEPQGFSITSNLRVPMADEYGLLDLSC